MALPPGNESSAKALTEKKISESFLKVYRNPLVPELTKFKGCSFIYKFDNELP